MKTQILAACSLLFGSLESSVHVIGDSHCQEFSNISNCSIHHLGPRTMHRVGRDGLAILDFRSLGVQENDVVILAFGEIDVRCHIGKQRDFYGRALTEIIDTLLENYFKTVLENSAFYNNLTVLTYTVTPPIPVALNIAYESYGPVEDRVFISKLLNQKLIESSHHLGVDVIDVYNDYADNDGILLENLSDGSVHIHSCCNWIIQEKLHEILHKN